MNMLFLSWEWIPHARDLSFYSVFNAGELNYTTTAKCEVRAFVTDTSANLAELNLPDQVNNLQMSHACVFGHRNKHVCSVSYDGPALYRCITSHLIPSRDGPC